MTATKRSTIQDGPEPARRRARYAPRACEACRKRKGRCDGRHPCAYCIGRVVECSYGDPPESWQHAMKDQPTQALPSHDGESQSPDLAHTLGHLMGLVANIQDQLDTLMMARSYGHRAEGVDQGISPAYQQASPDSGARIPDAGPGRSVNADHLLLASSRKVSRRFYGPTSPDYSLNAAQMKMTQETGQLAAPSIDDSVSDEEASLSRRGEHASPRHRDGTGAQQHQRRLLKFREMLRQEDAVRLLSIYQEVIGELHPILDLEQLGKRVTRVYQDQDQVYDGPVDDDSEDMLIILNVTLAIALRADSVLSHPGLAEELYGNCREAIDAKLETPGTTVRDVIIALLVVSD
ncbi:hypothetical protein FE257_008846 [Aspergillus nanangensis]|uniref:Zn(2)-C6 fungal-type domain-containing protein n=1 Tax=Aspergillus nanangensis TaxID=2582783 RepID=A0AAD4CKM3_ASPNN|nr:hypothetical protein FE257_008846 [Aspergillus nanangensis]